MYHHLDKDQEVKCDAHYFELENDVTLLPINIQRKNVLSIVNVRCA